jgi:hypothetical protein
MSSYYLDDHLSLVEGTRRFADDNCGHEISDEGFYVVAIRRSGYRDCLFRFSSDDGAAADAMLETLNRQGAESTETAPLGQLLALRR